MRRVVVTGIGIISPIGKSREEVIDSIKKSKCGISKIESFDIEGREISLASEIKNYKPDHYFCKKEQKRLDRVNQFGIIAARKALENSNLNRDMVSKLSAGVYVSSGIGGLSTIEKEHIRAQKRAYDKVSPYFIPMAISNLTAAHIAMDVQAHDSCQCIVTACASSTNAIGEAFRNIKHGYVDLIFAGGSEACITPLGIGGFTSLKALTSSKNPNRASIPFDRERSGFVMGEGAAILVLEELEHAKKRGVNILAEIIGYGSNCDAYHVTSPAPGGVYAAKSIEKAIKEAEINLEDVDYINAHGTSTELNDKYETMAIKKVFGENSKRIMLSSSKSQIGHLLGASGAAELAMTIYSMNENIIPPNINYEKEDAECDLNIVKNKYKEGKINYALKTSLGFGGHNACIIIRSYEG